MTSRSAAPTRAEFDTLKALWRLKQGTVAEVRAGCAALYGREPAYTTVMTLLGRLEAKKLVKVDKARLPFVYKARLKESSVVRSRLRDFLDTVFGGDASELVLQLVRDEALKPGDLRRIEARLAAREGRTR